MKINAIKAVRMFDNGFMNQSFAFGGEEGKAAFDEQIIYRSSLQNFLIDTDEGVILVDTGFRADFQAPARKLGAPLYMGELVDDYLSAFTKLGYSPEQVVKIIITHKHNDHTDALSFFPNAAIYIGKRAELLFSKLKMNRVQISLFDVVKTTGEVKDVFQFTYNEIGRASCRERV